MTLLPLMAQAAARLAATNVLPSPGLGAGDHDQGTGHVLEDDPEAGPELADGLGHLGLGGLDQRDGDLARPDLGVVGQLGQYRRRGDGLDVGAGPQAVVELVAHQGDADADQQPGQEADAQQLALAQAAR